MEGIPGIPEGPLEAGELADQWHLTERAEWNLRPQEWGAEMGTEAKKQTNSHGNPKKTPGLDVPSTSENTVSRSGQ